MSQFCPWGHALGPCLETFLVVATGESYQHPVGEGQGCDLNTLGCRDGLATESDPAPSVHSGGQETPPRMWQIV